MIYLKKNLLISTSIAYIYLPIIIFLFGWTKFFIAVPCVIILNYGIKKLCRDYSKNNEKGNLQISSWVLCLTIGFFLIIGYYAGWGNFVDQASDWGKHNAILADLVKKDWPVYYINGGGYIRKNPCLHII